jgi:2-polyprenyl-3-methyl-5-hydroxy-6-metoxy-1,4-benzoquinol methylase
MHTKKEPEVPEQHCPVCRTPHREIIYHLNEKQMEIVRCRNCNLVYTIHQKNLDQTGRESYSKDYFEKSGEDKDGSFLSRENIFRAKWERDLFPLIAKHIPEKGRLLDVGCAIGILVDEASRQGWDACGLEISTYAAQEAAKRFGANVVEGTLESTDLPSLSFDVITMIHTLEHIYNPRISLKKAYNLLKPGGLLVVEVPNFDCKQRKESGSDWEMLRPEEHWIHYSPQSLDRILGESGYTDITIQEAGGTGLLDQMNRPVARKIRKFIIRNIKYFDWLRRLMGGISRSVNGGQNLLALAKKPGNMDKSPSDSGLENEDSARQ